MSAGFLADQAKLAGANAVANFTNDQKTLLKTIGTLRNIRKDQLKSLDAYNKAVAAGGDKDRASKMASAAKKFSERFASANGAIGANASMGLSSAGKNGDDDKNKDRGYGAGLNNFGNDSYGANQNGSVGLFGSSQSSSSKSSSSASGAGSDADKNGSSAANDRRLIAEAIDARNSSKSKYDSNEDMTLFQKVTNAYIRNYDKILTKKKDKDITDQKE